MFQYYVYIVIVVKTNNVILNNNVYRADIHKQFPQDEYIIYYILW